MLLYLLSLLCFVMLRFSEPSNFTTDLVSGLVMVYGPQIRHEEMVSQVLIIPRSMTSRLIYCANTNRNAL